MYYLKYRPRAIDEIDNSNVRDTIKQLITSDSIPHALLLIGQKGTGKTSIARIIAKHLNGLTSDAGDHPDIMEMDAASNRGIDEIKNLIRETAYAPLAGKYRVFIIDEAHMITTEGFNALLKTLEEPPSTAVFILATTNVEKLPKTIVSRCAVVNFGRAKKQDLIHMLKRIAKGEKLTLEPKLLELVSDHADHSFRDAAKILEQLVVQQKANTYSEAEKYLGIVGRKDLLHILSTADLKQALTWTKSFVDSGGNIKYLLENTLEDLRLQLLVKSGVEVEEDVPQLTLSIAQISRLIRLFTESYNLLKISPVESLPLEIAIVEFYNSK